MSGATVGTGEQLYATLLLNDSYLPGALVLAHSLRDALTTKRLAVLVTLDSVSSDAITQLKAVYDYVIPVPRIRNQQPANLHLMNRSDLHSAFTKINLWKQTQFSRIVYLDADVVAYRAPDELFKLPHAFSAAPDIGWPDLVNTGVMVLTPNMGDYYAMLAMAERGISFDGADQGLINMHFKHNVNRLSFTYNVTPSAHYQYIPAYRHFQSSISMVHFIGSNKPWFSGRHSTQGNAPFDEMVGRWWAVYDRHYRTQETVSQSAVVWPADQSLAHGGAVATPASTSARRRTPPGSNEDNRAGQPSTGQTTGENSSQQASSSGSIANTSHSRQQIPAAPSEENTATKTTTDDHGPHRVDIVQESATHGHKQSPPSATVSWDAQRYPPPPGSKPEAMNFQLTHYEMSRDTTPFIPPVRYPSPPKNMWFELPEQSPPSSTKKPRQIFPWEAHQPTPSRSFTTATVYETDEPPHAHESDEGVKEPTSEDLVNTRPSKAAEKLSGSDVVTGNAQASSDPWSSYSRVNAWDDVPEIGRYVEGLQRHRRTKSQGGMRSTAGAASPGSGGASQAPRAFKVTDFPTEVERPSLPVTPAPIRRPSFWGDDNEPLDLADDGHSLPIAEGVPSQSEWVCVHGRRWGPANCLCGLADVGLPHKDPAARLQMLAQQQSEALLRKLSGDDGVPGRRPSHEIPSRPLPFGSEPVQSPTYAAYTAPAAVLSPQPVQGKQLTAGIVDDMSGRVDLPAEHAVKEKVSPPLVDESKE